MLHHLIIAPITANMTGVALCAAASGAVAVLEASREMLARRVENLVKCKNEFQELARCL